MAKLSDAELTTLIQGALDRHATRRGAQPARSAAEASVMALGETGAIVIREERRQRAADGSYRVVVQKLRRRVLA